MIGYVSQILYYLTWLHLRGDRGIIISIKGGPGAKCLVGERNQEPFDEGGKRN